MARLAVLPIYLLLLALGRASSTNTTQDFGPATKAELSCQGDNGGKSTTVKSLKDCQDHCRKYGQSCVPSYPPCPIPHPIPKVVCADALRRARAHLAGGSVFSFALARH